MSVLVNFSLFPTDKGSSVSAYVARIEKAIRDCGFPSQLGPMSTVVETETLAEALSVMERAYEAIKDCSRAYMSANFDIRPGHSGRLQAKVAKVEQLIRDEPTP